MQTETYSRRPFDVNAVRVTPQNADQIALWCGGKAGVGSYKVMGQSVSLVTVMVPGNGPNKGKMIEAKIGSWVVELHGQFRVYRDKQFREEFQKPQIWENDSNLRPGNLVEVIDPKDPHYGYQGEVEFVEQTCVTIPGVGGCMYNPFDLLEIGEYSEKTVALIADEAEANVKASSNEALDKINALREAAEAAFKENYTGEIPEEARQQMQGTLFEKGMTVRIVRSEGIHEGHEGTLMSRGAHFSKVRMPGEEIVNFPNGCVEPVVPPVTEINGIRTGYVVRVKLEANAYFGQTGTVVGLGKDRVRVLVAMHDDNEIPEAVAFQADEVEVITLDKMVPHLERTEATDHLMEKLKELDESADFKQDDMVETLNSLTNTAGTKMPPGTTGRVTVTGIDSPVGESIEVLFSDGGYGCFRPDELKKL